MLAEHLVGLYQEIETPHPACVMTIGGIFPGEQGIVISVGCE
jgi:hypothetical protein